MSAKTSFLSQKLGTTSLAHNGGFLHIHQTLSLEERRMLTLMYVSEIANESAVE
jgi:hypothetical protein